MTKRAGYQADRDRIGELIETACALIPLPGVDSQENLKALVEQIIDSEQRVAHFARLQQRELDPLSADPRSDAFDPLKAAILHRDAGELDEAFWLIFLFVHFGKHRVAGWRYSRDVYGRLGSDPDAWWKWENVYTDIETFRWWLDGAQSEILRPPRPHGFGNHRKRESMNAWSDKGTGAAVASYVEWIESLGGSHQSMVATLVRSTPNETFETMYDSMKAVTRFGRVGRFDYLMTLKKLGLIAATPPHSYIAGSTGPLAGARLLFDGPDETSSPMEAQGKLRRLSDSTGLSPDILEDAICNWQKSPSAYRRFST